MTNPIKLEMPKYVQTMYTMMTIWIGAMIKYIAEVQNSSIRFASLARMFVIWEAAVWPTAARLSLSDFW